MTKVRNNETINVKHLFIYRRQNNNMVHFYEKGGFLLKSFSRSAAASDYTNAKNLRTFQALKKAELHLFNK